VSLPDALEAAAGAMPGDAEAIRPANGDPLRLLEGLGDVAAPRVLHWLLEHRTKDAQELAEAWAEAQAGVRALQACSLEGLPKAGRKLLRRLHHRLRSQGVALREPVPTPTVATLPRLEEELSGAWLSPLDPSGARLAYLLEDNPSGGARVFEVVFNDDQGILGFEVYAAPRGRARRFLKELAGRDRAVASEAPVEAVHALLARACAHQRPDRGAPRTFGEWRSHLTRAPQETPLPGTLAREALGGTPDPAALERAVGLVEAGRVGPWPPEREALLAVFERIRTALDSPVIVSGETRREQLDDLLADAVEEVFDAPGCALAAHRLRESAYGFWKQDDLEAARACLAGAAALEKGPARENPLARKLLELPLRPALTALEVAEEGTAGEAGGDESRIVKP